MSASVSITDTNILTALRNFLVAYLPSGVAVIRAEINRVAEPSGTDFVVMTPTMRTRLQTNVDTYASASQGAELTLLNSLQAMQVTVQLDVHGPSSDANAQVVSTLLRDYVACSFFAASGFDITPLYAGDPHQTPFLNGENQFEFRWTVEAVLQVNAVVTIGQQFADTLTTTIYEVDASNGEFGHFIFGDSSF